MRYGVILFLFLTGTVCSGTLSAAYRNPILKVLLFSGSRGVYLYNPRGLALSNSGRPLGAGAKVLVTPKPGGGLLVNNRQSAGPTLRIAARGKTRVINLSENKKRHYLGDFDVQSFEKGFHLVNLVPTESYLEGVLNAEISTRWHMEVVKAQAVISRTFALFKREKHIRKPWHLTAGHFDQVYKGTDIADERGRAAIQATTGIVVGFKGQLAQTFYHSNCGGRTADPGNIWKYQLPYLKVKPVPFGTKDPRYHWEITLSSRELEAIINRTGLVSGPIKDLQVSRRTPSSRVHELTIVGDQTRTVSGPAFRRASGYRTIQSLIFDIERVPGGFRFKGRGNGHGVGLSQWSAKEMAEAGYKYHQILYYFYHDIELMRHKS